LEVNALLSMMWQATGAADFACMEPKQMSTGLVRMSAMLSEKMVPLVEAIKLHVKPYVQLLV
jgi:hypothetical protein